MVENMTDKALLTYYNCTKCQGTKDFKCRMCEKSLVELLKRNKNMIRRFSGKLYDMFNNSFKYSHMEIEDFKVELQLQFMEDWKKYTHLEYIDDNFSTIKNSFRSYSYIKKRYLQSLICMVESETKMIDNIWKGGGSGTECETESIMDTTLLKINYKDFSDKIIEKIDYENFVSTLSEREKQIIEMYNTGYSRQEIAKEIGLSPKTIIVILEKISIKASKYYQEKLYYKPRKENSSQKEKKKNKKKISRDLPNLSEKNIETKFKSIEQAIRIKNRYPSIYDNTQKYMYTAIWMLKVKKCIEEKKSMPRYFQKHCKELGLYSFFYETPINKFQNTLSVKSN